jgi:hypothetical protein
MATPQDWAQGYLEQGREDLQAAIQAGASAPSTVAMLLQMVFEKFAKAALLKTGTPLTNLAKSHHVASHLIQTLALNPALLTVLGGSNPAVWRAAFPLVLELENAHPATRFDPATRKAIPRAFPEMLEFPWEDPHSKDIRWPAKDLPIAQRFASPTSTDLTQLLKFAQALSTQHSALFP